MILLLWKNKKPSGLILVGYIPYKEDIDSFESFFKQVKSYNPQIIAKEIANKFKDEKEKDDVSVIVVKLER